MKYIKWIIGLITLCIGLFSLIILLESKANFNFIFIANILLALLGGICLIIKRKVGWILTHLFYIFILTISIFAVVHTKGEIHIVLFPEREARYLIGILSAATVVLTSLVWLNIKKTVKHYNISEGERLITSLVGIVWGLFLAL